MGNTSLIFVILYGITFNFRQFLIMITQAHVQLEYHTCTLYMYSVDVHVHAL